MSVTLGGGAHLLVLNAIIFIFFYRIPYCFAKIAASISAFGRCEAALIARENDSHAVFQDEVVLQSRLSRKARGTSHNAMAARDAYRRECTARDSVFGFLVIASRRGLCMGLLKQSALKSR